MYNQLMEMQFPYNSITFFSFLLILLTVVKKWKNSKKFNQNQKLPPGPWKMPLIGSLHHLIRNGSPPHLILRDLAREHGHLMHLQLGEISAIVVSSPRIAEEVMKTHDLSFASKPESLAFNIICYENKDIAFSPYGDYWRQMRKICVQELLTVKSVRSFAPIRHDEASRLIASVQALAGKPINLTEKITTYTSSMVCRAAFGKECRNQNTFVQLVKELFALAGGFSLADLFPSIKILYLLSGMKFKISKIHHQIDAILEDIINAHTEATEKRNGVFGEEDLIDILLRMKERNDLQFPITNDGIKAVIFDMFASGVEASSNVVEWALSEMVKKPEVMAKAQSEIRQAFNGKKTIDENDISGLNFLKLVIMETLRLHPSAPVVPRACREDCEIDGYFIPRKTKVLINTWTIGRDAEYWKDAHSFNPERFEDSPIDFAGNHFQYIPFGAGRRICPGISFGLANVELPLALLLYHFNWKLPPGVNELDMTETVGFTIPRKYNLQLVPTLYDPSQ